MTNPLRNTFIINHAFRKFFVASILISVITQLNTLVDIYIAGYELNGETSIIKVWKNGVITNLTDGENDNSTASAVFVK